MFTQYLSDVAPVFHMSSPQRSLDFDVFLAPTRLKVNGRRFSATLKLSGLMASTDSPSSARISSPATRCFFQMGWDGYEKPGIQYIPSRLNGFCPYHENINLYYSVAKPETHEKHHHARCFFFHQNNMGREHQDERKVSGAF